SAASRSRKAPGTFRASLFMIETGNGPATVKVTLHYKFSAGTAFSGFTSSAKEYTMYPAQFLAVSDLTTAVIGENRSSYGDLRNIDVDVEVLDGSGRVIPV